MSEQKRRARDKVYELAYVYRIVDDTTNDTIYIGSTSQPLNKRMCAHRVCAVRSQAPAYKLPLYQQMRQVGLENVRIVLIEEYHNITKLELTKMEQVAMDKHVHPSRSGASLLRGTYHTKNVRRAYVSDEQRKAEGAEAQQRWLANNPNYHRERYLENPDFYKERTRAWVANNSERHKCHACGFASALLTNYTIHCGSQRHKLAMATSQITNMKESLTIVRDALNTAQVALEATLSSITLPDTLSSLTLSNDGVSFASANDGGASDSEATDTE